MAGEYWGKVKAMMDEKGKQLKDVGPSTAIELMGLNGAPMPGEPFAVVADEQKAREITEYRVQKRKNADVAAPSAMASMEQMMAKLQNKETSDLNLLVKADVEGSAQAIKSSLEFMSCSMRLKARWKACLRRNAARPLSVTPKFLKSLISRSLARLLGVRSLKAASNAVQVCAYCVMMW